MVIRGHTLILGMFAVVAVIAVSGYNALRSASRMRFAIGVYAEPRPGITEPGLIAASSAETEGVIRLPLYHPILVRIEKSTAGRSSLQAVALLLTQEGELLFPPQVLLVGKDVQGQPTEQTRFPPLSQTPSQSLLSVVVVRVLLASPATVKRITDAVAGGGPVHLTYSRLLSAARSLSGHAEMVTTEIRGR